THIGGRNRARTSPRERVLHYPTLGIVIPQTGPKDEDHLQWYRDIPYAYCDTHLPKEHPKSNLSTIRLLSLFVDFSTPFPKARWRRVNVSPSVLENWFDLIIKKGGEKYFGENVYRNEISIYPTPSAGYSWLSIDSKDSSCNIFEIPTNSILEFRFELKEFLLSPTKFGSNSQPFQVYDVVQVTSKLLIHREKESRGMVWCSILTRWSITSHTIITTRGEFTFTLKNVDSTMLPYMIENSSVGANIDSHSMDVYSMCRIGEKLKPQISRSRFYALVV
ncbi:hypothetical protein Goari_004447, partial [Gossypium aridum]|nr:hypothetical protein [Gossypium aridum]